MAELVATMPVLPLTVGMRVQFEAVSPTTGAAVAGVTVSSAVLYAADTVAVDAPAFDSLPPLLTYGPATGAG